MALTFATVSNDGVSTIGVVQSREITDKAQVAKAKTAAGAVYQTAVYGKGDKSLSMELLLDSEGTPPTAGAELAHDSVTWHVTESKRSEANEDWKKLSISGEAKVS